MSGLKIERTVSFQVEGPRDSYCATTYNRADAVLVKKLATTIPNLRCLKEGSKQPRGIYIYKRLGNKRYPLVEVYDPRLAAKVRANLHQIKGD